MAEILGTGVNPTTNVLNRIATLQQQNFNQLMCSNAKILEALNALGGIGITPPTEGLAVIERFTAIENGTTDSGLYSVSFMNVGTDSATVLGQPLLAGESITFESFLDILTNTYNRVPAIAYEASSTATLHISTVA